MVDGACHCTLWVDQVCMLYQVVVFLRAYVVNERPADTVSPFSILL